MKKFMLIVCLLVVMAFTACAGQPVTQEIVNNYYFDEFQEVPGMVTIEHKTVPQPLSKKDVYNMTVPWAVLGATLLIF